MSVFDAHACYAPAREVLLVLDGPPSLDLLIYLHNWGVSVCLDFTQPYFVDLLGNGARLASLSELQTHPLEGRFRVYQANLQIDAQYSSQRVQADLRCDDSYPLDIEEVYQHSKQYFQGQLVPSRRVWQVRLDASKVGQACQHDQVQAELLPKVKLEPEDVK